MMPVQTIFVDRKEFGKLVLSFKVKIIMYAEIAII